MKKTVFLWITAILAVVLLLGSYLVGEISGMENAADIMRVIGFISLVVFTVYMFRGEKE